MLLLVPLTLLKRRVHTVLTILLERRTCVNQGRDVGGTKRAVVVISANLAVDMSAVDGVVAAVVIIVLVVVIVVVVVVIVIVIAIIIAVGVIVGPE